MKYENIETENNFSDEVAYNEKIEEFSKLYEEAQKSINENYDNKIKIEREIKEKSEELKNHALHGREDSEDSIFTILNQIKELKKEVSLLNIMKDELIYQRNEYQKERDRYQTIKKNVYDKEKQAQFIEQLNSNILNSEGFFFIQEEGQYNEYFLFKQTGSEAKIKCYENDGYVVFNNLEGKTKRYKNPKKLYEELSINYKGFKNKWEQYVVDESRQILYSAELDKIYDLFNTNELLKDRFGKRFRFSELLNKNRTSSLFIEARVEKSSWNTYYEIEISSTNEGELQISLTLNNSMSFNLLEEVYSIIKEIKKLKEAEKLPITGGLF